MKDLYLLNYNNYANRVVKKLSTLAEYEPYLIGDVVQNINFNPNDGVSTQVLINAKYAELGTPDYLIVTSVGSDEIESRWFVIESSRTRAGQYSLALKRDTVADSILDVLSADSYILKGYVKPSNPLIYQSEGISFNQIKKQEILLKDGTQCPWIVAYISPDTAKDNQKPITGDIEGYYDSEYARLEDYPFFEYSIAEYADQDTCAVGCPVITYSWVEPIENTIYLYLNSNKTGDQHLGRLKGTTCYTNKPGLEDLMVDKWIKQGSLDDIQTISELIPNLRFHSKIEELREQDGRILKVGKDLYKVKLNETTNQKLVNSIEVGSAADRIINNLFGEWNTDLKAPDKVYPEQKFAAGELEIRGTTYKLDLIKLGSATDTITFQFNLSDAILSNDETPYGIICMPYSDKYNVRKADGTPEPNVLTANSRLKIMQALGTVANLLYDIQIVPYCPIRNLVYDAAGGEIYTKNNVRAISVTVKDTGNYVTSMIVAQKANFSFTIPYEITIDDVKTTNETEM